MESVIAGDLGSPEDAGRRFTGFAAQQRITELAAPVTAIAERPATGWRLYRDAAAVDSEIAADWRELQMLRHRLFSRIIGDMPAGALADGLTTKTAVDTAWTIA